MDMDMRVTKRNGILEDMAFDKILMRIKKLGNEVNIHINYTSLAMKVIDQLYDKIHTTKIDELTAEQCASLSTQNPDYSTLASRVIISNHQKNIKKILTLQFALFKVFPIFKGLALRKPTLVRTERTGR